VPCSYKSAQKLVKFVHVKSVFFNALQQAQIARDCNTGITAASRAKLSFQNMSECCKATKSSGFFLGDLLLIESSGVRML